MTLNDLLAGLDYGVRRSEGQNNASGCGSFVDPVDETFAGEDRGGGDGDVGFPFCPLFEFDGDIFLLQGAGEELLLGELVGEGARAVGAFFGEVGDDAGVAPGKHAVEVAEFREDTPAQAG